MAIKSSREDHAKFVLTSSEMAADYAKVHSFYVSKLENELVSSKIVSFFFPFFEKESVIERHNPQNICSLKFTLRYLKFNEKIDAPNMIKV